MTKMDKGFARMLPKTLDLSDLANIAQTQDMAQTQNFCHGIDKEEARDLDQTCDGSQCEVGKRRVCWR